MALKIYDEFAPRATAPSAEFVGGSIKGESVSGANDGTLLKAILINDYVGFTDALLAEAGMTSNGSADTALSSQRLEAIKSLIANRYTDNMIKLQQLIVENAAGDALPANGSTIDYVDGDEIAEGWFADGAVTGATKDTFENVKGSGLIYTEITIPDNVSLSDLFASVMTASATGYTQTYADGVKVILTEPVSKTARLAVSLTEMTEGFEVGGVSQQLGRIAELSYDDIKRHTAHYIVDSYQSDILWYKIWSNGYVEQGGVSSGTNVLVITLPIPYSEHRSVNSATLRAGSNASKILSTDVGSLTQFTIFGSTSDLLSCVWESRGK